MPGGQVVDGELTAGDVVHAGRADAVVRAAVEHHDGQAAVPQFGDALGVETDRRDDHSADALFFEEVQTAALLGRRTVARAPEGVEAVGVHGGLGALREIGEVRVAEVLQDDAEGAAASLAELPGALVAYEAELADDGAHAFTGRFGHQIWPV